MGGRAERPPGRGDGHARETKASIVESVFLDGEELVYYLKAESVAHAQAVYARSQHAIDEYHRRFKDETFAEQRTLELLIDFENF